MNIYITDTYSDGKNWYRKYSNGWVEQGGYIDSLYDAKVTLHVPMKDTNYTVLTGKNYDISSTVGSSAAINVYSKTTTDFTVNGRGQGGKGYGEAISGSWTVYGFAK